MEWRPSIVLKGAEAEAEAEANEVLTALRLIGVNVRLEGEDRNKAIKVIESFLKRYKNCCWPILIIEISGAIRRELLKSRNVIDVNMVSQVVDYLNNGCVEKKKKKEKNDGSETDSDEEEDDEEYDWKDEPDRYQGSDEEEEDSGFEDDSEEDEVELKKVADAAAAAEAAAKKEMEDLHEPRWRKQCIEEMISLSEEKRLSVKKGDEDEIFEMMIPFIRGSGYYEDRMEIFLSTVKKHIIRCSTLDDVDTINTALKTALERNDFSFEEDRWKIIEGIDSNTGATREEDDMADAKDQVNHSEEDTADAKNQVHHSLEKNMVPTTEEIATTMNQIHQEEKREYEDKMKIEEQEVLIRPNQREQAKESAGNAYSCIRERLEKGGTNKRKLAEV